MKDLVSKTTVIGVRIPQKLKEELEELNINYTKEIRQYLEKRVKEEKAKKLIKEINNFMKQIKPINQNLSAEMIREDREERDQNWSQQSSQTPAS